MPRLTVLLGFSFLCVCKPSGDSVSQQISKSDVRSTDSLSAASAFRLDETRQVIFMDTRISPGLRRRFDIGLGSITLETLSVTDNQLTFQCTQEVEGGYTIYECMVPVSSTPIEVRIAPDGTPGETSFDLARCKVIRRGSVFLE